MLDWKLVRDFASYVISEFLHSEPDIGSVLEAREASLKNRCTDFVLVMLGFP
jgi:hypothetical protein